jgi:helix-turn-helix protein
VQLRAFAQQEKRAGYWRAYRALRDQGLRINHKRVQRLWQLAELQVPPRRAASKSVPLQATFPRHVTPALAAQVQVSPTIFSKIRRWMGANCGA